MSIPLPNLDDKTFQQMMDEAKALIPRFSKNWTNFNPSDPGITLLELFAWINETIIYRQNRITDETKWRLVGLLTDPRGTAAVDILVDNTGSGSPVIVDPATAAIAFEISLSPPQGSMRFETVTAATVDAGAKGIIRFYNVKPFEESSFALATKTRALRNQLIPIVPANDTVKGQLGLHPLIHHPDLYSQSIAHLYLRHAPTVSIADDADTWVFKPDLLGSDWNDKHFTFDYHRRALVFGDGARGAIPFAGKTVTVNNLWVSDGAAANVAQYSGWLPLTPGSFGSAALTNPVKAQGGADWFSGATDGEILDQAVRDSLSFHRSRPRAVTRADYEALAVQAYAPDEAGRVERAQVIENFNLDAFYSEVNDDEDDGHFDGVPLDQSLNHLTVVLVDTFLSRQSPPFAGPVPADSQRIIDTVKSHLDERRLLTTRLHVALADLVRLRMTLRVKIDEDQVPSQDEAARRIKAAVRAYFDPVTGGVDGTGRKVGQAFFASEIFNLLEPLGFVEFLDGVTSEFDRDPGLSLLTGQPLQPNELLVLDDGLLPSGEFTYPIVEIL